MRRCQTDGDRSGSDPAIRRGLPRAPGVVVGDGRFAVPPSATRRSQTALAIPRPPRSRAGLALSAAQVLTPAAVLGHGVVEVAPQRIEHQFVLSDILQGVLGQRVESELLEQVLEETLLRRCRTNRSGLPV